MERNASYQPKGGRKWKREEGRVVVTWQISQSNRTKRGFEAHACRFRAIRTKRKRKPIDNLNRWERAMGKGFKGFSKMKERQTYRTLQMTESFRNLRTKSSQPVLSCRHLKVYCVLCTAFFFVHATCQQSRWPSNRQVPWTHGRTTSQRPSFFTLLHYVR